MIQTRTVRRFPLSFVKTSTTERCCVPKHVICVVSNANQNTVKTEIGLEGSFEIICLTLFATRGRVLSRLFRIITNYD